jgi:hypothetical protein
MNKSVGVVLVVLGLVVMIWGGFGFKTREKILDIGPIKATKETTHHLPFAPIIGGLVFVGGIVVLVSGRSRSSS